MANKVRFGVSQARYALETDEGFGNWNRIPGAVSIGLEPQESQTDFYADNTVYFTQLGAASDTVTVEISDLADQAKIDLLGYVRKAEGAGLILPVNAKRKRFALAFQVEGDEDALRVCVYGGTLGRPSSTYNTTNDSTDPQTMSIEGTFGGRAFVINEQETPVLYYTSLEGDSDFDSFFTAVPMPGTLPQ